MRGERLISILILLQGNRQMTAKSLSRKLEVSERTIYRDMEALSSVGIPVIAERGKYGGWSLLEKVGGQAVLGRQLELPTPWLTKRHGYDPTFLMG